MSSSDDQIIQSVDGIISAVEKLVGDIRVAPDIKTEAKDFALNKVGAVAKDLDLINRALFLNEFPASPEDIEIQDEAARASIIADSDHTINDMLSSWAQPGSQIEEGAGAEKPSKKPRIVVSPVTRSVSDKKEEESAAGDEREEKQDFEESQDFGESQDFSVASSFQESLLSSLSHSETSLIGEKQLSENEPIEEVEQETCDFEERQDDGQEFLETETHTDDVLEADEAVLGAVQETEAQEIEAHQSEVEKAGTVLQAGFIPQGKKPSDDLTLIRGIDAEVSDLLAQHGIQSFLDIATFREADMLCLSEELSDPCRVSRENWIEQATLLSQNVSTYYAQKSKDETFFDRLWLNKYYTTHPEVIEELVSADFYEDVTEVGLNEPTLEPISEPIVETSNEGPTQSETDSAEVQEFTDALLAKKLALEAELASLKAQMVQKTEEDQNRETDAPFLEQQDEIEAEVVVSPVVEVLTHEEGHNELADVSVQHEDEEGSDFSTDDDLGDGPIWHEEVSTGKDYVPPVVEDDFDTETAAEDYEASEPSFAHRQDDTLQDAFHASSEQSFSDHPVEHSASFLNTQEESAYSEAGEPSQFISGTEYEETSSAHDESYTYNVDQLSDHVPMSHLDEMSDFHVQGDGQRDASDELKQGGYLPVPPSRAFSPDLAAGQAFPPDNAQVGGLKGDEFGERPSSFNQAEYMDDISVPRDTVMPEEAPIRADTRQEAEPPSFMERSLASSLDPAGFEQDQPSGHDGFVRGLQANEMVSDIVPEIKEKIGDGRTLGQYLASKSQGEVAETPNDEPAYVSPPLPPQTETDGELYRQDMSISLPPSPPVAPQIHMSDMRHSAQPPSNIPHPPAPPVANGIRVPPAVSRDMHAGLPHENGRPEMGHSEVGHSEIIQSEMRPNETLTEPQQGRPNVPPFVDGPEPRAMPPLPPKALPPQEGLLPQKGLPPQSPPTRVEGPTPPPFTDMPSPMSEGQAYADTQRIIAAKRKAEVERAMNRSDIPNGQAYMDTQHLIDSGTAYQPPQTSERFTGPDGVPPLPPEAAKAASAYPRGANNPELHYRGQSVEYNLEQNLQQYPQDNLPPHGANDGRLPPNNGERNGKENSDAPSGFKAKAKQLAESLQRSFVDKD
jgi:predicted flap endonuclease-1-like 5' DNA nuclease